MFTGLTLGTGEISRRTPRGAECELVVRPDFDWASPLALGESIAVSGACLTVTQILGERAFAAYASAETAARTTLGTDKKVNLERALAVGDRLGGHIVTGHVDGPGRLLALEKAGASFLCRIAAAPEIMELVVPKGSITVSGVSLTVNEAGADSFTVNLIPHTAEATTLGLLKPGAVVNLETDLIGKYLHKFVSRGAAPSALSLEFLARHGFG